MIPDGSGHFTRAMGMLVDKDNLGFGYRSWRYAMVVTDGVIEALFREASIRDNADDDPYEMTTPENLLGYLRNAIPQEEEVILKIRQFVEPHMSFAYRLLQSRCDGLLKYDEPLFFTTTLESGEISRSQLRDNLTVS